MYSLLGAHPRVHEYRDEWAVCIFEPQLAGQVQIQIELSAALMRRFPMGMVLCNPQPRAGRGSRRHMLCKTVSIDIKPIKDQIDSTFAPNSNAFSTRVRHCARLADIDVVEQSCPTACIHSFQQSIIPIFLHITYSLHHSHSTQILTKLPAGE